MLTGIPRMITITQCWILTAGERAGQKVGFCFFHNYQYNLSLPGAPEYPGIPELKVRDEGQRAPEERAVGALGRHLPSEPARSVRRHHPLLSGTYRLWAPANQAELFQERDDTNNSTWADLRIGASGVTVLRSTANPGGSPWPRRRRTGSFSHPCSVNWGTAFRIALGPALPALLAGAARPLMHVIRLQVRRDTYIR
jgi:hypothetical protein